MRFNSNLFLLASLFGVGTALRRSCKPDDTDPDNSGNGWYTVTRNDNLQKVALDFCSKGTDLAKLNVGTPFYDGNIYTVPCKIRRRDCARIPGSDYGYYTVVDGDLFNAIASDFCADTTSLKSLNPDTVKKDNSITPGSILRVPCGWN
ncbi:uncharacterized protein L3040_005207 [Drepanopeziza brunnea f. sp. 'multigermtubi']|uniref:uncharacterized protein n=1 Tax=Drepanopeziza brunnea f. sp. 'multigermtubi' TaxID=698441 RepID=UPI00238BEC91|nr:hypothetical protein L3040_005207 [Drepanopeziza brunnea f. sp. 'multigermtubi']